MMPPHISQPTQLTNDRSAGEPARSPAELSCPSALIAFSDNQQQGPDIEHLFPPSESVQLSPPSLAERHSYLSSTTTHFTQLLFSSPLISPVVSNMLEVAIATTPIKNNIFFMAVILSGFVLVDGNFIYDLLLITMTAAIYYQRIFLYLATKRELSTIHFRQLIKL
jgi:hypothetical protein